HVIAASVVERPNSHDAAVIGFETPARILAAAFDRILRTSPLLPPSLTRTTAAASVLAVRVMDPGGGVIFQSAPVSGSEFVAAGALGENAGGLRYQVVLRPDAADRLIIGGLPRSRLWLTLSLLALTSALLAVSIIQLRREAELARMRADFI